ncbi:hypothetical protein BRC65_08065 [Halobacteriales archaeon QH_2_65_14]|jgi:hypothetical protein|nr:MAG: hypothetical protein BRC65_08065 [Halobacteriales archaeon QH_2_65_14]
MTELGDRVLALIVIATGLAGLFGWGTGSLLEAEGTTRIVTYLVLMVVYFAILVGVWEFFKRTETQPEAERDRRDA